MLLLQPSECIVVVPEELGILAVGHANGKVCRVL
jgi:hypothetical protein